MRWCLLLALAVPSLAQTGSISGCVKDAAGAPASDYLIQAMGFAGRTGGDGSFSFKSLTAGQIDLFVAGPAGTARQSIMLRAGQNLTVNLTLRSLSSSLISGRVIDSNGDPVAGVKVALRRREFSNGVLGYFPNGDVATDKDGRYELRGAESGRGYLLEVYTPATGDDEPDPADPKDRPLEMPHTYYPGTPLVEDALVVTLGTSESRTGMDIRIRKSPTYCLDGTIVDANTPSQAQYTIAIEDGQGHVTRQVDSGVSGKDGKFRNCHLFSGTYRIAPGDSTVNDRGYLGGAMEATIRDGDLHDVRLDVQPVPPVTFEAVWDTEPSDHKAMPRIGYDVSNLDQSTRHMFSGVAAEGHMNSSTPLPAVDFGIRVHTMPPGFYLKDLLISGVSSLRRPVVTWNAILGGAHLRFVIARDGGSIAGVAADANGNPVSNVNVVFIPIDAGSPAELPQAISTTITDQNGAYQSATLAPGRYRVVGTSSAILPTPECMEKLWAARIGAAEADVQPGNAVAVKLLPSPLE
jgi:hypothetical protein